MIRLVYFINKPFLGNKADLTIKSAIAIVFIPKMVQFISMFEEYPLILMDLLDMVMLLYTSDISSNVSSC